MRRPGIPTLVMVAGLALPAHGEGAAGIRRVAAPEGQSDLDIPQLFAGTCGWCHSDGGRAPGKGPQLMDSPRTDEFLRNRIRTGKAGAMPAFGQSFSNADIDAIIQYIRGLKPHED